MPPLDDITLIQAFVRRKIIPMATANLRLEPGFNIAQLVSHKGALLATTNLADKSRAVCLRPETKYSELISQVLVEGNLVPLGADDHGFRRYEHRPTPAGYDLNYTEARALWRTWRQQERHSRSSATLMIFNSGAWDIVQTMTFSQEDLFLQTATAEIILTARDRLVWLSPSPTTQPATQIFSHCSQAAATPPRVPLSDRPVAPPPVIGAPCTAVRFYQGKLYVQTIAGEVVVEGTNLKFWVKPADATPHRPKTTTVGP